MQPRAALLFLVPLNPEAYSHGMMSRAQPLSPPRTGHSKRVTLDRLLSKLGIASRSVAQEWIRAGRVRINQRVVRLPGTWVSWPDDDLSLDHQSIQERSKRFILFHKPKGVITTRQDEQGRKTIFDVLPEELKALHAVGRLDQATSGLLLLTNDSTLSSFLTDPTHQIPRLYLVTVRGNVADQTKHAAISGLLDQGERLHCENVTIQKRSGRESHLEVTLMEGKNREIRRLFKALGHEVTRLRRIHYGPFSLGDLPPGAWRELPIEEVTTVLRLSLHANDATQS
ncbi:MAG: Pseudouridine synthase, rsuA family [Nitrospira sp.]|jgi:23S rRNA pseudouridine2605 synthase|nr:Pseudouridine synthase, rsuA family [Nitrospira sp.]